jgi:hypothetical protein
LSLYNETILKQTHDSQYSAAQLEDQIKDAKAEEQRQTPSSENVVVPNLDQLMSSVRSPESFPLEGGAGVEQPSSQQVSFPPNEVIGLGLFEQLPSLQLVEDL